MYKIGDGYPYSDFPQSGHVALLQYEWKGRIVVLGLRNSYKFYINTDRNFYKLKKNAYLPQN